jgi:5'-3' exonuclease
MRKVLIDGDIIAYQAAFSAESKSAKAAEDKVDSIIERILEETIYLYPFYSHQEFQVYLTGSTNFRTDVAKTAVYKGNRSAPKPDHLEATRVRMVRAWDAITSVGEEADDLLAIDATELNHNCTIASIDKDLLQVPCWHYNFGKNKHSYVNEFEGNLFFYTQMLTGDAVDNIKGVRGIGPKNAQRLLQYATNEGEMLDVINKAYDYNQDLILENGRLLWLRRYPNQMWSPPQYSLS